MAGFDQTDIKTIKEALEKKGMLEASKLVTDVMANTYAAAGTPDRCHEKPEEYKSAGITMPVIFTMWTNTKLAIRTIKEYITQAKNLMKILGAKGSLTAVNKSYMFAP